MNGIDHYIQVNTIKFDKDLMELICPQVGYYDPDKPIPYIRDENLPEIEPDEDELIFVVTSELDAAVTIQAYTINGGANAITWEIYGNNNVLVDSFDINSGTSNLYNLPTGQGITLNNSHESYIIKLKGKTSKINRFAIPSSSNYSGMGWPILETHIRCKELYYTQAAFKDNKYIKYIKFYGAHDNLDYFKDFAQNTEGLAEVIMPTSLNSLRTLENAFQNCGAEKISIPVTSLPYVTTIKTAFRGSKIKENPFKTITEIPLCTDASYCLYGTINLKTKVVMPAMNDVTTLTYIARESAITDLEFKGEWNDLTTAQGIIMDAYNLKRLKLPLKWILKSANVLASIIRDAPALEELILPDIINLSANSIKSIGVASWVYQTALPINTLKYISEAEWWVDSDFEYTNHTVPLSRALTEIKQNIKPLNITLKGSASVPKFIEKIDIDYSGLNDASTVDLQYNNLNKIELERIATLLPSVSSGTFNVRFNPGHATFDNTIATAKGWTVTGR